MRQPTCFDCIYGKHIEGIPQTQWDPGESDTVECQHQLLSEQWKEKFEKIFEEVNYDENELPKKCGLFQPILIKKCSLESCQKEMNVPEYNWKHWANSYEFYSTDNYSTRREVVCSKDCKDAIEVMSKLMFSIHKEQKN